MDEATNVIDRPPEIDEPAGRRRRARPGRVGGGGCRTTPRSTASAGVAVGVVLLFHAGFPWARGGYLGVSTFFTLSGFLITSLLLGEHGANRRISLGAFWARRMRRLLPGLGGHARGGGLRLARVHRPAAPSGLSGDIVASALQVANWRFLFDDQSYADLFASPSPVLHFWSLAIEEQFYWVFPLLTAVVFLVGHGLGAGLRGRARRPARRVGRDDRHARVPARATTVYYATYTRMGEILVGLAAGRGRVARRSPACAWCRAWPPSAGPLALVAMVWCWWNLEQETPFISQGGLLVYALLSGTLVLAACVPGPVRSAARRSSRCGCSASSPTGSTSCTGRSSWCSTGSAPASTSCRSSSCASRSRWRWRSPSYFLLEKPIRRGWSLPRVPMAAVAGVTVVVVTVVGVVVPSAPGSDVDPRVQALCEDTKFQDPALVPADARIGMAFGDSTMLQTGLGLVAWGNETEAPRAAVRRPHRRPRVLGVARRRAAVATATSAPCRPGATRGSTRIPPEAQRLREVYGHLDFAVIQTGPWEVTDRRIPGDDQWRAPGDPVYDDFLAREFAAVTDPFMEQGLVVVWVLSPAHRHRAQRGTAARGPVPRVRPRPHGSAQRDRASGWPTSATGAVTVDLPGYLARPAGRRDGRRAAAPTACTSPADRVRGGRRLAGPGPARRHRRRAQPTGAPAPAPVARRARSRPSRPTWRCLTAAPDASGAATSGGVSRP